MKRFALLLTFTLTLVWVTCGKGLAQDAPTRLACVGDSITAGAGVSDRETKSYPAFLKQWLGPKWDVQNFGASGATLLKKGNLPYWERPQFQKALAFKPDVLVVVLGTNDSKHGATDNPKIADNWQYKADFVADYKALLNEFKKQNPAVKLWLGLPTPAFSPNGPGIDGEIIEKEIVPLVRVVAAQAEAQIIDLHSALQEPKLFKDKVHPGDVGARLLAATVFRALTGQDAPALPQPATVTPPAKGNFHLYLLMGQSNMVGRDTSGLDSQTDNPRILALNGDGRWVVAREPMHIGGTGIGPGISFAAAMIKDNPNITIGLVPCAVGGSSLGRWVKGRDRYEDALARAKIAAEKGTFKGALWHQGEADTTSPNRAEGYGKQAAQMFKDLRSDLGVPNLPIVAGQLGEFLSPEKYPYADRVRAAIQSLPTEAPNVGFADSNGLGDKGDKLHFNVAAEHEMGVRFAKAMKVLQREMSKQP